MGNTLRQVRNVHWIVVEDADAETASINTAARSESTRICLVAIQALYIPSPWQRNTDDDSDSANTVAHTFRSFLVLLRCLVRATGLSYQLLEELWCAVHEGCAANSKVYAARHLQSGEPTYWL